VNDDVRTWRRALLVLINCKATVPAPDGQILAETQQVLDRRGALKRAPVSLTVSDAVALGIAGLFSSPTEAGQVLERLYRNGVVDGAELIEAAKFEQGYASPEGHAALYCLIGWARAKEHDGSAG
jgi:hypothetical protein